MEQAVVAVAETVRSVMDRIGAAALPAVALSEFAAAQLLAVRILIPHSSETNADSLQRQED